MNISLVLRAVFSALVFACMVSACKNSTPTSGTPPVTADSGRLLPLAVGNSWTYTYQLNGKTTEYTYKLVGKVTVPYVDAFNNLLGTAEFHHIDGKGVAMPYLVYMCMGYIGDTLHLGYFLSPFRIGPDTIRSNNRLADKPTVGGVPEYAFRVIGVEDVTVPAGTFTGCYRRRYQPTNQGYIEDTWYKRGVGIVKVAKIENGQIVEPLELKSYTLK